MQILSQEILDFLNQGCQCNSSGGGTPQTLSINSPDLVISGGNSLDLTPLVKDLETLTEIVANGTQYDYTKEDGTIDTIQAGTFISADTGNAIATGTD